MRIALPWNRRLARTRTHRRAGITLIEVLAAIFIMAIGLLALLVLFPLGALSMAQSVKDDRAAGIANDAVTLSKAGVDVLSQTREFVMVSLSQGAADPNTATLLREKYKELEVQAADLEARLQELRLSLQTAKDQRKLDGLLAQIRAIKKSLDALAKLLQLLNGGIIQPNA